MHLLMTVARTCMNTMFRERNTLCPYSMHMTYHIHYHVTMMACLCTRMLVTNTLTQSCLRPQRTVSHYSMLVRSRLHAKV
jgi:hypothetical protein